MVILSIASNVESRVFPISKTRDSRNLHQKNLEPHKIKLKLPSPDVATMPDSVPARQVRLGNKKVHFMVKKGSSSL